MASKKPKIVLLCDSPFATTGLGRVTKYFLKMLPEFDWKIWGINHPTHIVSTNGSRAVYDKSAFNADFEVVSPKFLDANAKDFYKFHLFLEYIRQEEPDFVITSIDYDRLLEHADELNKLKIENGFRWIAYVPFDRQNFNRREVDAFNYPDEVVAITKFGKELLKKNGLRREVHQIWHAIDPKEFPTLKKKEIAEFKDMFFSNIKDIHSKFVLGTVNRNFARKDPKRLLKALSLLESGDNSILYMHGSPVTYEGDDLRQTSDYYGLTGRVMFPQAQNGSNWNEVAGLPNEVLNKIYRSFDVFVTASSGEGFGYTTAEALLTETPIIAPRNTSFPELINENGYLVDMIEEAFYYGNYQEPWGIADTKQIAEMIEHVQNNPEEAAQKARAGREWVLKNLDLPVIAEQWREILV